MPLVSFYIPCKHQKTSAFLIFPGGLERDQWDEMGWNIEVVVEIGSKLAKVFCNVDYHVHSVLIVEKDRSQKIFSIAYVNFISSDGTCLQDAIHDLAVFKVSFGSLKFEIKGTFTLLFYRLEKDFLILFLATL